MDRKLLLPTINLPVLTLVTGIALSLTLTQAIAGEVLAKSILPVFRSVLSQLDGRTEVPIILPTKTVSSNSQPVREFHPYVGQASVSKSSYDISLDFTPDCQGAGACYFGTISGEKITPSLPSFLQMIKEYESWINGDFKPSAIAEGRPKAIAPGKPGYITLARGIKGVFLPYTCGANCGTAKIAWEQSGYRYSVGIKSGSFKEVVSMANSAIENSR